MALIPKPDRKSRSWPRFCSDTKGGPSSALVLVHHATVTIDPGCGRSHWQAAWAGVDQVEAVDPLEQQHLADDRVRRWRRSPRR
jgi:hypothetical protein